MEVSGRRIENDDKVTPEHECQPCREDGDAQKAHGYCRNCKEYLCETCYKYHRRPKPFKDHVLVKDDIRENIEKDESTEDFDESPPPVPERKKVIDSKCHIHCGEDLKYHCRQHNEIVCSVCAMKEHKACKNVDYIPEICDSENKLLVGKIEYVGEKVEYKLQQEMEALQHAEKTYESALSALNTQRERVNRFFAETEKGFSDKILSFRSDNKSREKEMLEIKQKLIESKKEAMTTTAPGSEGKKYILMQKTEEQVDDINKKLPGVFGHASLTFSYKPQEPLPELGEVVVDQQQADVPTRKLKILEKVNIAGGKERCSITDMVIFSNSRVLVILTDNLNERLIIISKMYDVEFYQCSSAPWSVADISDAEIAVSFPADAEVRFFTVGTTISCSHRKTIKVSEAPSGIGYHKSERSLIIAVGSHLEYWSLDGVLLRTTPAYENDICYLTLAEDEKILFSSYITHALCLVTPDGSVSKSFQYIDDNMLGPFGISSDASENIYVCGYQCLRIVSKEGKWEQIIAREDGYGPQAVLVCDKTNRLYVGQGKGHNYADVLILRL